jgi:hypothetical protein
LCVIWAWPMGLPKSSMTAGHAHHFPASTLCLNSVRAGHKSRAQIQLQNIGLMRRGPHCLGILGNHNAAPSVGGSPWLFTGLSAVAVRFAANARPMRTPRQPDRVDRPGPPRGSGNGGVGSFLNQLHKFYCACVGNIIIGLFAARQRGPALLLDIVTAVVGAFLLQSGKLHCLHVL